MMALALLLIPAPALGGPWVPEPGHGFLQLGTTWFRSTDPARGASTTGFDYSKTTLSAYGEVGLPGRLLVTLEVPWAIARNRARGGEHLVAVGDDDQQIGRIAFESIGETERPDSNRPAHRGTGV